MYSNRPVKFKSVPSLDPRTDVDGRILLIATVKDPQTVTGCLPDLPRSYGVLSTCLFAGFVVFRFKDGHMMTRRQEC